MELVEEGDDEARGGRDALEGGLAALDLRARPPRAGIARASRGFPWVLLGSPRRRIVVNPDESLVKAAQQELLN